MKMRKIKPYLRKVKKELKQALKDFYNQPQKVYVCESALEYVDIEITLPD